MFPMALHRVIGAITIRFFNSIDPTFAGSNNLYSLIVLILLKNSFKLELLPATCVA
jgi:hypothetical protein